MAARLVGGRLRGFAHLQRHDNGNIADKINSGKALNESF
jgi:hypothetical protein